MYYKFGRSYWGQGYATEACRAMIRFAFDEMRLMRIITITHKDNTNSIKLLQRLGMRIEAAPERWVGFLMATLTNDQY